MVIQEDRTKLRLASPLGPGSDEAWPRFDGDSHRLSGLGYKTIGAPEQWWHMDYVDWRRVHGVCWPRRIDVTWEADGRPWLRLDLEALAAEPPVGSHLPRAAQLS